MKHNFVVGIIGGLIGSAMLLIVLSATGIVGARDADGSRSDVSHVNSVAAATLTSTFTYQGQLVSSGSPVSNTCDFQFSLYDALSLGNRIGITQTVSNVSVNRGLFTALLNVGNQFGDTAFNGEARWLSIAVRCPTGGTYTPLNPRQPLTSLPYALPGLRTFPNATSPNVVGGFSGNIISASVVGGVIGGGGLSGFPNRVRADYASIGGGYANIASGYEANVDGGASNTASGFAATVGGGSYITASGTIATVGGGQFNTASNAETTVGGGFYNTASGNAATVGGGYTNTASGSSTTIGGGSANTASGSATTVGGGEFNTASGFAATVGGGYVNTASDTFATVGGGYGNTASGGNATVAGGQNNAANGLNSMILGGTNNTVTGTNSMAGGYNALANGDGCFAWGDHSTSNVIDCQGNNLWSIRATGGFYFRPSSTVLCSLIDASGWQCIPVSDRNAKQDFVSVNPRQVLNQVVGLPIEQWAYTDDATHIQHIGPMAQDFYAAFNVGADDKHINPVDSIGVALAAIQGLYQENQDLKGQNASLETRLTNLEQNAQPVPFNWINLLGVIAFAGFLSNWIQQRRTTRGQS